MVETSLWHDEVDMLSAVADGKLITWYYPQTIFIDPSLLKKTCLLKDARWLIFFP